MREIIPLKIKNGQRIIAFMLSQMLVIMMVLTTVISATSVASGYTGVVGQTTTGNIGKSSEFYVDGSTTARAYNSQVKSRISQVDESRIYYEVTGKGMVWKHNINMNSSSTFRYQTKVGYSMDGGSFTISSSPTADWYPWTYGSGKCNDTNFGCSHYEATDAKTYYFDRHHTKRTVRFCSETSNKVAMNKYNSSGNKISGTRAAGSVKATSTTSTITIDGHSQYTLTYDANGGYGSVPSMQTYCADSSCSYSSTPTVVFGSVYKDNYSFAGWNTRRDGSGTQCYVNQPLPSSLMNDNVVLYAQWYYDPPKTTYTISYDADGGYGAPSSQIKTEGEGIYLSNTVPYKYSEVIGEYNVSLDANGGSVSKSSMSSTVSKSYSFYRWLYGGRYWDPGDYFNMDEDATLRAIWSYSTDAERLSLPTPTKSGCDFDGWYTASNGGTQVSSSYKPNSDITLYAHWSPKGYSVRYDANGGSGAPSTQTKYNGTDMTLSTTKPTRADSTKSGYRVTFNANGGSVSPSSATSTITTSYTFGSWNTSRTGTGKTYAAGGQYTANEETTLYAQWISKDTAGSVKLPTPTKDDNRFRGWYTSATGGTKINSETYTPTSNTELYAHWSPNIIFNKITGNTSVSGIELKRIQADSSGKAKFTAKLKDGETFKILSLGEGSKYKITEQGTKMYKPSYKTDAVNAVRKSASAASGATLATPFEMIGKDAGYMFINEKSELTGIELTIKKALAGDLITDADKNAEFTFKYHIEGLDPGIDYPVYLPGAAVNDDDDDYNESLITSITPTTSKKPGDSGYETSGSITETFKMKAGGDSIKNSYRIKGLPEGAKFWIEEVTRTSSSEKFNYDVKYEVTRGTETTKKIADYGEKQIASNEYGLRSATETIKDANVDYVFTNSKSGRHKITLEKKYAIDGVEMQSSRKYKFEISATGLDANKTYTSTDGSVSFSTDETGTITQRNDTNLENAAIITLQVGKKVTFENIPGTARFRVLERGTSAVPKFTLKDTVTGKTLAENEGRYGENSTFEVPDDVIFKNDQLLTITNTANSKANLKIKKVIDGSGSNSKDTFTARVELKNLEAKASYDTSEILGDKLGGRTGKITADENGECIVTITLRQKSEFEFNRLPNTTLFKITEEANDKGYTPSYDVETLGGISLIGKVGNENKALSTPWETLSTDSTFTFTNTKEAAEPTKTVTDKDNITADGVGPEVNVTENTVENRNSKWIYTVKQEVPAGSSEMSITDYLPPYLETILHENPEINMVHAIFHKNNGKDIEGNLTKKRVVVTDPDSGDATTVTKYTNDAFELKYNDLPLRCELTANLVDKELLSEGGVVELTFTVYLPSTVTTEELEEAGCIATDGTKLVFCNVADTTVSKNLMTTNETVTNVPLSTGLTVKKHVTGTLGDKDKEFNFTVNLTDLTPNEDFVLNKPESIIVTASYNEDSSAVVFKAVGSSDKQPRKDVELTVYEDTNDKASLGKIKTDSAGKAEMQISTGDYILASGSSEEKFVIDTKLNSDGSGVVPTVSGFEKMAVAGTGNKTEFASNAKGKATVNFTLKADEMAIFESLTPGASYNVTEAAETQYTAAYVVQKGVDTVLSPSGANKTNNKSLSTGVNTLASEKPVVIQYNNTVNTKDIKVSKVAVGSSKELPGATLSLKDAHGKTLETWVSKDTPKTLTVAYDTEYVLTEDAAPAGYKVTNDVHFRVNVSGEIEIKKGSDWVPQSKDVITLVDEYDQFEIEIEKRDFDTTDLLAGARLVLKKKDGTVVKEWTSGSNEGVKISLGMGDYVLSEADVPSGYKKAADIAFTVNNEGKLSSSTPGAVSGSVLTMYDTRETKKVILKKIVKGDLGDTEGAFGFVAEFTNLNRSTKYTFGNSSFETDGHGNAIVKFGMKAKDVFEFELPVGATYKFTENASSHKAALEVTADNRTSVIATNPVANTEMNKELSTKLETVDSDDGNITVTYTNTREMASVTGVNDNFKQKLVVYGGIASILALSAFVLFRRRKNLKNDI